MGMSAVDLAGEPQGCLPLNFEKILKTELDEPKLPDSLVGLIFWTTQLRTEEAPLNYR